MDAATLGFDPDAKCGWRRPPVGAALGCCE